MDVLEIKIVFSVVIMILLLAVLFEVPTISCKRDFSPWKPSFVSSFREKDASVPTHYDATQP